MTRSVVGRPQGRPRAQARGEARSAEQILREQVTKSRGGDPIFAADHRSVSTSMHHVTESAVLASEIEQLPDLHGFLKFASQPEWKRVKLSVSGE
jgi:hypothetical protein